MAPPDRMFRVEFMEGFGFPKCTRRERTKRNFETAEDCARFVATLRALPSHHEVLGVYETGTSWVEWPEAWWPDPSTCTAEGVPA